MWELFKVHILLLVAKTEIKGQGQTFVMLSQEKYTVVSIRTCLNEKEGIKARDNCATYRKSYHSLHNFNAWNQSQPRF